MPRSKRIPVGNPKRLSPEDRNLLNVLQLLAWGGGFRVVAEEVHDGNVRFLLIDPKSKKRLCLDDVPSEGLNPQIQLVRDSVCKVLESRFSIGAGMSDISASYYGHDAATLNYLRLLELKGVDEKTRADLVKSLKAIVYDGLESIIVNIGILDPSQAERTSDVEKMLFNRQSKGIRGKLILAPKKENIKDVSKYSKYAAELKSFASVQTRRNLLEASVRKIRDKAKEAGRLLKAEEEKQIEMFDDSISELNREEESYLSERNPLRELINKNWREYAGALGSSTLPVGEHRFDIIRDGQKWRGVMSLYIISGLVRPDDVKRELDSTKRQLASMRQLVEREHQKARRLGKDPEKESRDEYAKMTELEKQVATLSRQLEDIRGSKSPTSQTTFWMFWLPYISQDPIDYTKTFNFDGSEKYEKDAPILKGREMQSFQIDDAITAKRFLEREVDNQLKWYRDRGIKVFFAKKGKAKKEEEIEAKMAASGHPAYRKVLTDPHDWGSIVRSIQERKNKKELRGNKTLRGLESYEFKSGNQVKAKDIDVGDQVWFNNGWRTVYVVAGESDRSAKIGEPGKTRVIIRIEYAGEDADGRPTPRELSMGEDDNILVRKPRGRSGEPRDSGLYSDILAEAQTLMLLRGLDPVEKGQKVKDVLERLKTLRESLSSDLEYGVSSISQRTLLREQVQNIDRAINLLTPLSGATRSKRVFFPPEKKKRPSLRDIGDEGKIEKKEEKLARIHAKKLKKISDAGRRQSIAEAVDDVNVKIKSAEAEIEKRKADYQEAASGDDHEKRTVALSRIDPIRKEILRLKSEREKLLSLDRVSAPKSIKEMKRDIKRKKNPTSKKKESTMKRISMRDPMFDMSSVQKTRRAKKNIEKAYSDGLLTKSSYEKLLDKADKSMEKFVDSALGLDKRKTNPKKNPRPRDVDEVLFEYKFSEISAAEAKKRLKALGLKKLEIDTLLGHVSRAPKSNPPLADYRARRARAQAEIARARAEAARAQAEARAASGSRRVKKGSEALFPRIREAYEKYIVGEEAPELADQELLSQATEIAENARDLLDQWRESAVEANLRGTMPLYNKLVMALLESLLAREAFARLDETTKAGQMDTLRKRIQKEIVDIMEGRKTIGQVKKTSERLAVEAGSTTAMGPSGGMVSTGARVSNPGREIHDRNAHKFAKRSVAKWGKYRSTGKCSHLVDAYSDMVIAHQEFEYIGDKKSAREIASGMKQAKSQMANLLKSGLKAD